MNKTDLKASQVFVVKIEAARRQLDASIRMLLAQEDELAVHTVAAAAFAVLRDIRRQRGKSNLALTLGVGAYAFACDLAEGRIQALPDNIDTGMARLIQEMAVRFQKSGIPAWSEAEFPVSKFEEATHWGHFNLPANFLKHADRDPRAVMQVDKFDPIPVIMGAGLAYFELMKSSTPEMRAFHVYQAASTGVVDGLVEPYLGWVAELQGLEKATIALKCRELLDRFKNE